MRDGERTLHQRERLHVEHVAARGRVIEAVIHEVQVGLAHPLLVLRSIAEVGAERGAQSLRMARFDDARGEGIQRRLGGAGHRFAAGIGGRDRSRRHRGDGRRDGRHRGGGRDGLARAG
jgi:hypothetical protein